MWPIVVDLLPELFDMFQISAIVYTHASPAIVYNDNPIVNVSNGMQRGAPGRTIFLAPAGKT